MVERPILFSGPMVRALLAGRKTQTRRVLKRQPQRHYWECIEGYELRSTPTNLVTVDGKVAVQFHHRIPLNSHEDVEPWNVCPYGQPGDRLWVREAFLFPKSLDDLSPAEVGDKALDAGYSAPWCPTQYEVDGARRTAQEWASFMTPPTEAVPGRLRASMHMPRWASRITLEITEVRVERLQSISEADAIDEGLQSTDGGAWLPGPCDHPEWAYHLLWDQINGEGSWAANPWVWAVSFHLVAPTT